MIINTRKKRHKYNAVRVDTGDFVFGSKAEAAYAVHLDYRKKAGEIVGYLKQVPFHFPGKIKYVADFLIFESDGTTRLVDVKGVETQVFRIKKRLMREHYPWIELEIVTSKGKTW